ncbi:MAG TPA: NUDIX hydrolase [Chloroflexia bacterium]|nr:NUDIX hydrolase [Chloroflexia bacterium]
MLPKVLKVDTPFQGPAFEVRVEEVELRPGKATRLDVIQHADAVTILPLDDDGNVWFVRQYRHPARQYLLELPAGTLDPGEDPAPAANRELQEEISMRAASLEELAAFYLAPGYSTELMHVYIATGLTASQLDQDEDEVITIEKVPAAQAAGLAVDGTLRDAKSIAAVLAAARKLGW